MPEGNIIGFRHGWQGLTPEGIAEFQPIDLTLEAVRGIHGSGGTILGSGRGPQDVDVMIDTLQEHRVNILFGVGGDGTFHAIKEVADRIRKRNLPIAVIGLPKTIDNDISFIDRSFGFHTAVTEAVEMLKRAHVEAEDAYPRSVVMVQLMGRRSGYLAALAGVSQGDCNAVLIPEIDFDLEEVGAGPKGRGFLNWVHRRVLDRNHALIAVAEGAGERHISTSELDLSGNQRVGEIGGFLTDRVKEYFARVGLEVKTVFLNPAHFVRSVSADADDANHCDALAYDAVHAAMAGLTNCMPSLLNGYRVYIPIPLAISRPNNVRPHGNLWNRVLTRTSQPNFRIPT